MAMSTARLSSLDDSELASLATAGEGQAFATLYDRHERRVFGFCMRMLGSEDAAAEASQETFMRLLVRLPALRGRDLNFVAYALATARNACYDALASRKRVQPVAETPEPAGPEPGALELDPERAALLAATREQVRAAHAQLSDRQREVLALRELEQLSYEEIGAVIELNENAVAQLISRARIRLRDLLRGGQLASIAAATPDCERALPLLARMQDAQPGGDEEREWLRAHMAACETCRLSEAAMHEAGLSYRALGPVVPLLWLRHTTIARAAELVHADWGELAAQTPAPADRGHSDAGTAGTSGPAVPGDVGAAHGGRAGALKGALVAHRRRRLALVAVLAALIAAVLAASIRPDARIAAGKAAPRALGVAAVSQAAPAAHVRRAALRRLLGGSSAVPSAQIPAGASLALAQPPLTHASAPRHPPRTRAAQPVPGTHAAPRAAAPGTQTTPAPPPPAQAPPSSTPAGESPPGAAGGSGSGTGTTGSGTGTTGSGTGTSTGGGCTLAIACP
jgi:RNA polymerase sigma-70 factor (ECF subfamily)